MKQVPGSKRYPPEKARQYSDNINDADMWLTKSGPANVPIKSNMGIKRIIPVEISIREINE